MTFFGGKHSHHFFQQPLANRSELTGDPPSKTRPRHPMVPKSTDLFRKEIPSGKVSECFRSVKKNGFIALWLQVFDNMLKVIPPLVDNGSASLKSGREIWSSSPHLRMGRSSALFFVEGRSAVRHGTERLIDLLRSSIATSNPNTKWGSILWLETHTMSKHRTGVVELTSGHPMSYC